MTLSTVIRLCLVVALLCNGLAGAHAGRQAVVSPLATAVAGNACHQDHPGLSAAAATSHGQGDLLSCCNEACHCVCLQSVIVPQYFPVVLSGRLMAYLAPDSSWSSRSPVPLLRPPIA